MKDQFILLSSTENYPVIIGISNISIIEPDVETGGAFVTLNFARNNDLWPKRVQVKETFEQIKTYIGL